MHLGIENESNDQDLQQGNIEDFFVTGGSMKGIIK